MIVDESALSPTIESIDATLVSSDAGVELQVLRLDRVHPLASGNKLYKLHGWLQKARREDATTLISVGGAHSNHLLALALVAQECGFASAAVVRYQPRAALTPTLQHAASAGMQLHFVDGETYRRRSEPEFAASWVSRYRKAIWIPEGGSGTPGLLGAAQLMRALNSRPFQPDVLAVAAGSGGFAAGLLAAGEAHQVVAAFAMARDPSLAAAVEALASGHRCSGAHLDFFEATDGRFGHFDASLLEFAMRWHQQTGILLDPVYTVRLFRRALAHMAAGGWQGRRVLLVHSGGLQGWAGRWPDVHKFGGEEAKNWLRQALQQEADQLGFPLSTLAPGLA